MKTITLEIDAYDDDCKLLLRMKMTHRPDMTELPPNPGEDPDIWIAMMDPLKPSQVFVPSDLDSFQRYERLTANGVYHQMGEPQWLEPDGKFFYFVSRTPVYRSPYRPGLVKGHHLAFLDALRETATINMLGAGKHLADTYSLDKTQAREVLVYWMETFGGDLR